MGLTKEQLLGQAPRRVEVAIAGGTVTLQAPTAGAWLEYQRWLGSLPEDSLEHLMRIVAITAVDDEGKPLLSDDDCRQLDHAVLTTLSRAAFDLTKTATGVEVAKGES